MRMSAASKRTWSIIVIISLVLSMLGIPPVQADANAPPTKVVLVGDLQTKFGGEEWDPASEATTMTDMGNGEYRLTRTLPPGTYQYKVAINGSWDESYGFANYTNQDGAQQDGNIKITLDQETVVTFYYHHLTHKIADSTYYTSMPADKLPRVIGSFQSVIGEAADWSAADAKLIMQDHDYDNVYSVTADIYDGKHEYQIALGDGSDSEVYPPSRETLELPQKSQVTFRYYAKDNSVEADYTMLADPVDPADPVPANHLRVHYQRTDNNYTNMGLWTFNDVEDPSTNWPNGATPFPNGQVDSYGAFVDIPLKAGAQKVGLVVVDRVSGNKDGGDKNFAIVSPEMNEVWLKEGSDTVYNFEPAELPADTVRIHYQRQDQNYDAYGLWLWGDDVATPSGEWPEDATMFPAGQEDRYGAYVDIPMKPDAQKLNFLVLDPSKGDAGKDGGDKGFALVDRFKHLFIKEGDDTVYVSPFGEVSTGLVSAEILSPGKIQLGFTMTDGLEADSLKKGLKIKDKDGNEVVINHAEITGKTTVELAAPFNLEALPLKVTYAGKTVAASTGWRMIDEMYYYDGDDLGATYQAGGAQLKLWAPTATAVSVNVYSKDDAVQLIGSVDLVQGEKGVWSVQLKPGDLGVPDFRGYFYQYEVTHNGVTKTVLDPYAKSMAEFRVNTKGEPEPDGDTVGKAAIVDLSQTNPASYDFADIPGYEKREDAIIWEIHVRDFTSDPSIEDDLNHATWGSYDAFKEKLDYIKSLGVTHIQLLPVMAWYYGDEAVMKERELEYSAQNNEYNWGYDPHSYFSPDGAYSENPKDPELRIKELKAMIDAIHEAGMGVILDVVYTHMAKADFLNDIVPNYYAFQDANGNFIGGFGNNLATNRKMAEKLMIDSVKYWFEEYKIDGMRWDMMGDATYESVQNAYDAAAAINPNALFIGEGWVTFGGHLSDPSLAGKGADQNWMDQTDDVGVFSDEFRNELKSGFGNEGEPRFITGGKRDIQTIFNNIKAQPGNTKEDDPGDMVQYIEAHDNLPLYDIIAQSIKKDPSIAANDREIHQRIRLGNLLTLTSQGTAFLHAGQEYGRTKQWFGQGTPEQKYHELKDETGKSFGYFIHDSYDSSDAINKFDWEKATNETKYPENNKTREYTTGLIELRKSTDAFRLGDQSLVDSNVTLLPIPEVQAQDLVIAYKNKATDGTGHYYVFVNADTKERTLTLNENLTSGLVLVDHDEAGATEVKNESGFTLTSQSITLEPLTAVVIKMDAAAAVQNSLSVDKDSYALQTGTTHQTTVQAGYNDGSKRNVTKNATYVSSNTEVVSVTAAGLVKGVAEGKAVITVSYGGFEQKITVTVTVDPVDDKRYVQFNYLRPDQDYKDWNLWVWNTGVKNDRIDFTQFENGVATALIEVAPETTSVGFVLRKGEDWSTAKQDIPADRVILLTPGEAVTKVNVTSMVHAIDILPSISGPVLEDGNITFLYRDDRLFRDGQMDTLTDVKLNIDGKLEKMSYVPDKEWFSYTLKGVAPGTYEYSFVVTYNGTTKEVTDPKNTVDGKSQVTYLKPTVKLGAAVSPSSISYNENAVLKLNVTSSEPVAYKEAYMDLTEVGGPAKVKLDPELFEQTIAVKDTVTAGRKQIPVTLVDEYGNRHTGEVTLTVKPRTSAGKLDFDWDEARIYFVLTDRFMDGDPSNNADADKSHLEAYHGGDFRGLIDKLDYIEDLGVNTLWITPIVDNIDFNQGASFNGKQYGYHGYWAKDFTKIDEHLGDLDTFKELIDKAHDRGIKIMVDVVLNHTGYGLKPGDNAPGITQQDKDRFSNMLRTDGLSSDVDPVKGDLAGLPDFMTENPDVRKQIIDWQAGWLERARTDRGDTIDYFRVDTVKHVDETTWKAFKNELTKINPDFKMIGEYFGATVDQDGGTLQSGQMDSLLDFGFKEKAKEFVNGNVESVEAYLADREAKLDNTKMMGQFLSSHDEDGFLSHYVGGDKAKLMAAAALQITSKGQPVIYYGEELGRSGKNAGDMSKGELSENRGDMPWDQLEAEKKLLTHYQKLLNIRADHSKVFSKGKRTSIAASDADGYIAFDKEYKGEHIVTAIHVKKEEKQVTLSVPFAAGSSVKDLYSGTVYDVSSDQKVTITLPSMSDGGTVILAAVPSETDGNDDGSEENGNDKEEIPDKGTENDGADSGSSTAPVVPGDSTVPGTKPNTGQIIISEQSLRSGQVTIELGAKDQEVLIPVKAGDILGSKPLELKRDGLTVQLPSSWLKELGKRVPADQAKAAVFSFKLKEIPRETASSLVSKAGASENAKLKLGSQMYDFDLSVQMKDGTVHKLDHVTAPVILRFAVDTGVNRKLAGIYALSDQGKLDYAGGKLEDGELIAEISHFGKYAVLEYNKSFADLSGHWSENAVKELAAKQIVMGTSDALFSPDQQLTRAQFAAMLVRALNLDDEGQGNAAFKDVDSKAWYASAVAAAHHHGLVSGKGKNVFAPNAVITREEMAVMLLRAYELKGDSSTSAGVPIFKDKDQISAWAAPKVNKVLTLGLMKGHANGTFAPKAAATRAESAQAMLNLLNQLQ
ncbi:pullulanase [Paenibacillus faecalis]|uniref:pullulanase n=1 Tax=Paenibacillus faecalis TaxID=2079532 RepID=UPI000D0FEA2D|nr:pullulanase [Paenibacillus faecalis]